jgi:hypothetical protein
MNADPRQHPSHLRFRQGSLFPREVSAASEIDAPIDVVWQTLTDFAHYAEWNPFTTHVETTLEVDSPVVLHVEMPGRSKSVRTECVNLVEPGQTICWGMHLGHPSLLCANRWQVLSKLQGDRTRYFTVDRFSGLMVPAMMWLYSEPMRRGFQSVADGLKVRAEAQA